MNSKTELNELFVFNIKHNFVKSFACKWSPDNFISILTDCGVHILEFLPDMKRTDDLSSFKRYFVEPCKETIAEETDIPVNKLICSWQPEQIYHLVNDVIMTPTLVSEKYRWSNAEFEKSAACCVQSLWSPIGVVTRSKCLLMTLSNIGMVEVVLLKKTLENDRINLTNMWIDHLRNKWELVDVDDEFEEHKKRVNRIQTVCMEWSPLYCENSFSFIVLAHRDGTLSIWKYLTSPDMELNNTVPLACEYATDEYRISSLNWIKVDEVTGFLVFGTLRGIVKLLTFDNCEGDIVCSNVTPLWTDNDDVRVTHVTSQTYDDRFLVLVLKGMFIVSFVISKSGTLICSNFTKTGNISITGCQEVAPFKYVLCCVTGFLVFLELKPTVNSIEMKLFPLKNNMKWDHISPTGLCSSRNNVLWMLSGVYSKEIDHLVIREPTPVVMCSPTVDIESILLNNSTRRLTDYWDCIEALKLSLDRNNGLDSKCIAKLTNYDEVSVYLLKIFMWMSRACESFAQKKKTPSKIEDITPSSKLEFLLKGKYGMELMKCVLESHESGVKLNEKQLKSLQYLKFVLAAFKTSDCFKTYLGQVTEKNIDDLVLRSKAVPTGELDKCLLCGEEISAVLCPNGHEGERCSLTFLQISEVRYYVCRLCETPVDPNIDEKLILCTFCDNVVDVNILVQ